MSYICGLLEWKRIYAGFLSFVNTLYMFCCWRSSYQEGRVGILLTGLNPPPFCACPKPGPRFQRCMSCFFWCSMSSVKMSGGWLFVLLIIMELMTITFINTIYTFNASKMTSYPMWWPHSKRQPYTLCDDLIPRHDLITYVMTSFQDMTL